MTLWLHVHGGYPSYKESGEDWRNSDYDAWKLVKALKGEPKKSATLQKKSGAWVTFGQNNVQPAFDLFGEWGAWKLQGLGLEGGFLVPVPSSTCLAFDQDPKGQRLADAIASRAPGFSAKAALCWKTELGKAAAGGGTRNPDTLLENLKVLDSGGHPNTVVLVDDVASSGGHLIACARALRAQGHHVEHALCAAQTVNTHPPDIWNIASKDLEVDWFETLGLDLGF